jgi:hypothetical protein
MNERIGYLLGGVHMKDYCLRPTSLTDVEGLASFNNAVDGGSSETLAPDVARELIDYGLHPGVPRTGNQASADPAKQSMRSELRVVLRGKCIAFVRVVDLCSDDPETLYYENPSGCVRGVLFALALQVALIIAACWVLSSL